VSTVIINGREQLLTVKDVAAILGVSDRFALRNLIKGKEIKAVLISPKVYRVRPVDLQAYLARRVK
jgi:excisionase family DNA binding protein